MKKNAMLKIAAVLLVAVLLTTCAISSTFAKYVSSTIKNEETVRVADWGLNVVATTWNTGFSATYGDKVASSDGKTKIVAPGTSGNMNFVYEITGTAEVDAEVVFKVTTNITEALAKELKFYKQDGTPTDLATIKSDIESLEIKFDANQTAAASGALTYKWMWAFEDGTNDQQKAEADKDDTKLGSATTLDELYIKVEAQVVQVGLGSADANRYPNP
jgi:hypothetical protein